MSETIEYSEELLVAKNIALKAGATMLYYFDGDQQTEIKEDGSPVTIADKEINSMVIAELKKKFPEDGVIGEEESTVEYGMGRKWFCDPIDGTIAYTWGTPTSVFSLGLVVDGKPQMGVVYDPYLDRIYTAVRGNGSYCNDQKLEVSQQGLDGGIVAVTSDVRRIAQGLPHVQSIADSKARLAVFSGAIYKATLVARGRFVCYVEKGVNAHDMAAVELVVQEAGGKVTGIEGEALDYTKPFNGTVVSNGVVHDELIRMIADLD
jgi:fructose-1,6-bisphosphatase/inositol monophosphatase family enzyme